MQFNEFFCFLLLLSLVPIMITLMVIVQVFTFSSKSLKLNEVEEKEFPLLVKEKELWTTWTSAREMDWVGTYSMKAMQVVYIRGWKSSKKPLYFCIYNIAGQKLFDFITFFSDGFSLTTSNSRDSQMLPNPPGKYVQALEGLMLDELYEQHLEMEKFLITVHCLHLQEPNKTLEQLLIESIQNQAAYVRSLSLWPLRGCYWFFIRRRKFKNLTIEQQFIRGLTKPPSAIL